VPARFLPRPSRRRWPGFLESHADKLTDDGRHRLVRHGHLPEREIMTGIGPVAVRAPRIRDRVGTGEERIAFSSAILPPYARRSKSLEVLIPILYLKGISTGGFEEALAALLGKDAGGLSASTIARLRDVWVDEHAIKLIQQIGYVHAMDLLLTARLIKAEEAARLGLVNRLLLRSELMAPTDPLPIVHYDARAGHRSLD
jgi:hypothetical protein